MLNAFSEQKKKLECEWTFVNLKSKKAICKHWPLEKKCLFSIKDKY